MKLYQVKEGGTKTEEELFEEYMSILAENKVGFTFKDYVELRTNDK